LARPRASRCAAPGSESPSAKPLKRSAACTIRRADGCAKPVSPSREQTSSLGAWTAVSGRKQKCEEQGRRHNTQRLRPLFRIWPLGCLRIKQPNESDGRRVVRGILSALVIGNFRTVAKSSALPLRVASIRAYELWLSSEVFHRVCAWRPSVLARSASARALPQY